MKWPMKKWSLIILLWYIFVDNTPWIQDPEKKTVWILKPGWSTYRDCWDVKVKLFERYASDPIILSREYMCIDMDYEEPPVIALSPEEIIGRLRSQLGDLIKQLRLMPQDALRRPQMP